MSEIKEPGFGLLSQLKGFNKKSLAKTETRVTTEDGKTLLETRDQDDNVVTKVTNLPLQHGFVADVMMDFQVGEILPGLIMASQDVAAEQEILEKYGVTHILNIASYVKNYFPSTIKYMNLTLLDVPDFHILPFFEEAFKFIDEGRKAGCVLVHCNAGRSRAATVTIGYLMKTQKMTLQVAYAHVKEARPAMSPNAGFMVQLETYGEQLQPERDDGVKEIQK